MNRAAMSLEEQSRELMWIGKLATVDELDFWEATARQYGGMFPGEMAALMQRRVELGSKA